MTEQPTIVLIWKGEKPDGVEALVIADMRDNDLLDVEPDDLVFHTVWLTADMEGPSVLVWGENGAFHAEYSAASRLETLNEAPLERRLTEAAICRYKRYVPPRTLRVTWSSSH